jgi:predicted transcriptional regulator
MSESANGNLSRGEMLKLLRKEHAESVQRTQALFRDQRQMQQSISKFINENPKTIPEIAAEIGKPAHEVLWFVAAMRKYGLVVEAGMEGDYPLYQTVKEVNS